MPGKNLRLLPQDLPNASEGSQFPPGRWKSQNLRQGCNFAEFGPQCLGRSPPRAPGKVADQLDPELETQ